MYKCNGRFVNMVELNTSNNIELFTLIKKELKDYQRFVSPQTFPENYRDFLTLLQLWFTRGRIYQFLVYRRSQNTLIGTIFFYSHNLKSSSVKISAFFSKDERRSCAVAESLGLAIAFASSVVKIKSILFAVYENNHHMHEIATKLDLDQCTESLSRSRNDVRKTYIYEIPTPKIREILFQLKRLGS